MEPCYTHILHHHHYFCGCDVVGEHDVIRTLLHRIYSGDDGVDVYGACDDGSHDVLNCIYGTIPFHFVNLGNKKMHNELFNITTVP